MTLVVAVTGKKSIWLLTDRRISYRHRTPNENARKLLMLETTDGVALVGYAGLGATALETEPGDWMGRVLRGRNLPLAQSLGVLADAIRARLPAHLERLGAQGPPSHVVIVPAFLNGELRLYSIEMVRGNGTSDYQCRLTRPVTRWQTSRGPVVPRLAIGGSGGIELHRHRRWADRRWARELLRMVRAHDAGRVSPEAVASCLARLNFDVHDSMPDKSVGRSCIVAWRFRERGGAHRLFSGLDPEVSPKFVRLATISCGRDINDIVQVLMPHSMPMLAAMLRGDSAKLDQEAITAELAKLPDQPDDSIT